MKLIDLDKAVTICDEDDNAVIYTNLKNAEVKAIPIEWILKWACEFIDPDSEGYKMAMELVHDWRKENEHKESD